VLQREKLNVYCPLANSKKDGDKKIFRVRHANKRKREIAGTVITYCD
jgi:hypothetical protein